MASITLKNVVTEFPIYGLQLNLRHALFRGAVGGLLRRRNGKSHRLTIRALDNVNLVLKHGDQLGIVGSNGAGKSTLLRVLAGIYEPVQGEINIQGRISPLFNQSPGLDPDDTGYENIVTCGLYLGMSRKEISSKVGEIEEFTELNEYLSLPVRTYSAGMMLRLGFAIATAIDPEILLLDEGLGTGDARFTQRARHRVEQLVGRSSIMVVASHSDALIQELCNRAILMDHGKIICDGPPDEVLREYNKMSSDGEQA